MTYAEMPVPLRTLLLKIAAHEDSDWPIGGESLSIDEFIDATTLHDRGMIEPIGCSGYSGYKTTDLGGKAVQAIMEASQMEDGDDQ